jgi:nucleoside-diphosphate-sugar epimerase
MAARGFLVVLGDGSQELSLIYAEDLARALIAAATSPRTVERVYFAAHSDVVRQRAFATAVGRAVRPDHPPVLITLPAAVARAGLWISGTAARLVGRSTVLTLDKANEYLAAAMTCSSATLERDSGWAANYSLAAGLAKTVGWYREHRWL